MHVLPTSLTLKEEHLIAQALSVPGREVALDFFILGIQTGMRAGELTQLRWEQIDFDNRTIQVNSKGNQRTIPMSAAVQGVLQRRLQAGDKSTELVFGTAPHNQMRLALRIWRKLSKKLGFLIFGLRNLRYTCATRLMDSGVSMAVVCHLLGWSSRKLPFKTHAAPVAPTPDDMSKVFGDASRSKQEPKE